MFTTLTLFSGPYALIARFVALGLLCASLIGFGAFKMHAHDKIKYDELKQEYANFKGGVEALGRAAEKQTAARIAADKLNKETTDANHAKTLAALRADNQRLLNARSSRSILPASTATAGSVEASTIRFDRGLLDDAIRRLDAGVSGIAEQGDEARLSLNVARQWSLKMTTEIR